MTTTEFLVAFFVVAVALRFCSLFISKRNEARLRAEGAEEFGAGNSRVIAVLHVTLYAAALIEGLWRNAPVDTLTWLGVVLYTCSMFVLAYVIHELGNLWSVKLLLASGHTLKQSWLFRTVRHPNYYLNILPELLGVALVTKAWLALAILFPSYLFALFQRIKLEEQVMRQRFPQYQ